MNHHQLLANNDLTRLTFANPNRYISISQYAEIELRKYSKEKKQHIYKSAFTDITEDDCYRWKTT